MNITSILKAALQKNVIKNEYSYVKSFVWWKGVEYEYVWMYKLDPEKCGFAVYTQ